MLATDSLARESANANDDGVGDQNEWDSDIEDSNSSEEFMYVRNYSVPNGGHTNKELKSLEAEQKKQVERLDNVKEADDGDSDVSSHQYNPSSSVWNSHEDQVKIMSRGEHSVTDHDVPMLQIICVCLLPQRYR